MATLGAAALNLLRLAGFRTIRAGVQAVMHDINQLLKMAGRQPEPAPCLHFYSALPMTFIAAVLFAASLSLLTPIGYPTPLVLFGSGFDRFLDMTREGTLLTIALTALRAWWNCRQFGI
jgi:hypothetical protein